MSKKTQYHHSFQINKVLKRTQNADTKSSNTTLENRNWAWSVCACQLHTIELSHLSETVSGNKWFLASFPKWTFFVASFNIKRTLRLVHSVYLIIRGLIFSISQPRPSEATLVPTTAAAATQHNRQPPLCYNSINRLCVQSTESLWSLSTRQYTLLTTLLRL